MIICLQEQNWILSGFVFTPKYCFTLFYVFVRFLSNTNISNFYQYKWSDWYFWTPMIMSDHNIIIRGQFTSMRVKVSSSTLCTVYISPKTESVFLGENMRKYSGVKLELQPLLLNYWGSPGTFLSKNMNFDFWLLSSITSHETS